ncbi:hypothetical protein [Moraxella bovoculi]|uniref:hypothetical protein n=1 Tax=Moraxella bovoculi TaxID=386891 RepID=UPI0012D3C947|nr:hypothetical protein [Moraxella bovoculi]
METVRTRLLDWIVLEVKFTDYDDFSVIHSASLLVNRYDEVQIDLSIKENQEKVRNAVYNKGCYQPIYEWEMQDYLADAV